MPSLVAQKILEEGERMGLAKRRETVPSFLLCNRDKRRIGLWPTGCR